MEKVNLAQKLTLLNVLSVYKFSCFLSTNFTRKHLINDTHTIEK